MRNRSVGTVGRMNAAGREKELDARANSPGGAGEEKKVEGGRWKASGNRSCRGSLEKGMLATREVSDYLTTRIAPSTRFHTSLN